MSSREENQTACELWTMMAQLTSMRGQMCQIHIDLKLRARSEQQLVGDINGALSTAEEAMRKLRLSIAARAAWEMSQRAARDPTFQ